MSKPVLEVGLTTLEGKNTRLRAVFDTGAYPSIVREDRIPTGATVIRRAEPAEMRTAATGGKLRITGGVIFVIEIGEKLVQTYALVSPDLAQDMLIGSETMQAWDITIQNSNGRTKVIVGRDLRDPDIQEVD
ncbi:MAG: hypothetical protein HYT87_10340 [Nitrospirae bacterium]|nr:hypothetical protein [Nitrospirota bacterium]